MPTDSFASLMTTEGGSDRARRRLNKGEVIDATVMQVAGEFVFIDVGMPSDGRIPRADLLDAEGKMRVAIGDRLRVSVVEPRFEGSLCKALGQAAPVGEAPIGNEVLSGRITRVEKFGVFVSTAKGDGLIPIRELPLPPGSDHRKLFSVGKDLTVVVLDANAQGKLRFSATRVARVEEEQNFRDFSSGASAAVATATTEEAVPTKAEASQKKKPPEKVGFGSLGDLMRGKLGSAAPTKAGAPSAPPRSDVLKRKR
ncbi:MAG: S1 RNA-binding domain-containing protein [Pseudomonadota bacterium]